MATTGCEADFVTQKPLILSDERERLRVRRGDELPIVRFVCIVCVDGDVPASELMQWEIELQMLRHASASLPNCIIFGECSNKPWMHGLKPQAVPGTDYSTPIQYTNINDQGRFAWVDIVLPDDFCGYDGHLVLRRASPTATTPSTGSSVQTSVASCPPQLSIISYMTYEHKGYKSGTPPTRALVINPAQECVGGCTLGVYTIHVCDLFFNGEEIFFPESYRQQLYRTIQVRGVGGDVIIREPENVVAAEMESFSVATGRMIMDPIVAFHSVQPAGYIENANTAGRPIHADTLDILMTPRARNKIIELRNRFKFVSSRQRFQHFVPRDIFPLLLCQRDEVAALLKVSTTWLKDRIRAFGINEWPARALMVHSSELRLSLLTLRLLLGGPHGVRARVAAGVKITQDVVDTIKNLHVSIRKLRHERFAILKDYLTKEFYEEFTRVAAIWCLDPNWDSQPPWEYTHKDHNLSFGFGRLSVVRNYPQQENNNESCNTTTSRTSEMPTSNGVQKVQQELSYI